MRTLKEGDVVRFFDKQYVEHRALVTAVHGNVTEEWMPCINLVYVSKDSAKKDPHGRQLERDSSVAHARHTKLLANSYLLDGEVLN